MVYFIGAYGFRFLKVGHTSGGLAKRFSSLQIGNPEELCVYAVLDGGRVVEQEVHKRFARNHERGEWYRHSGDFKTWLLGLGRHPRRREVLYLRSDRTPVPDHLWSAR